MPRTFTCTCRIRHYECDPYGHVNNANHLRCMQEAAFDASADAGHDLAKYRELGAFRLIRESGIEYLRPVTYDRTLTIRTWVADFRRIRSRREYEMTVDGEVAAKAYMESDYRENRIRFEDNGGSTFWQNTERDGVDLAPEAVPA